ncbi:nitroreductase [Bradyrhizobium sp. AUGA SZCCT0431]|nr:nitroreductase [Bradyrhizobium sp. AUGA SZCCT0431]
MDVAIKPKNIALSDIAAVDAAITSRRSCRQFLPKPVPSEVIVDILEVASRAPSGHNAQPWNVHVLTGAALRRFTAAMVASFNDYSLADQRVEDSDVYPTEWVSPYLERRRRVGGALYASLGIQRGDKERMHEQLRKNYEFFGAPVGMIFTVAEVMVRNVLDCGMFMQNIMIAARARQLETCPQAAFAVLRSAVQEALVLPDNVRVICGMALGHSDGQSPANGFVSEREPVTAFTRFYDT